MPSKGSKKPEKQKPGRPKKDSGPKKANQRDLDDKAASIGNDSKQTPKFSQNSLSQPKRKLDRKEKELSCSPAKKLGPRTRSMDSQNMDEEMHQVEVVDDDGILVSLNALLGKDGEIGDS